MPNARTLKKQVRELLQHSDPASVLSALGKYRPRQAVNALISQFYAADPEIRWRSIAVIGTLVGQLAGSDSESARVVMRRLMWMLNDESGGIGWGAPEAMAEIMVHSDAIAAEYRHILCSYIRPEQNYLEHPGLQRGLLWALGRMAQKRPEAVADILPELEMFLSSSDPYHRGYAAWAAGHVGNRDIVDQLKTLTDDVHQIELFDGYDLVNISVGALADQAIADIYRKTEKS